MTSLSGTTCRIFKTPDVLDLFTRLITEIAAVANADGASLPTDFVPKLVQKVRTYPDGKGSSMLTDRLAGQPLELGAKNGIIRQRARQYGIPTPVNDTLHTLLSVINIS
ncbi:MAG: ketopantoate reductase C-terminal domain-containing protein [Saprospiraceae bacterium]